MNACTNISMVQTRYTRFRARKQVRYWVLLNGTFGIVQRALRQLPIQLFHYHPTASVTEMLHDLGWTSMELRRTMTRLTLPLYKMSRGQIDIEATYLKPSL